MLKNVKIATRVSIIVTLVLVIGFGFLWKTIDYKSSDLVGNLITNQMKDAVDTRAYIINSYVESAEEYLAAFAMSDEVKDLLLDQESSEKTQRAQQYTVDFANVKGVFEGLYIANYETHVLTHTSEGAIGIYTRKGDGLKELQDNILSKKEITNSGIMKSPSTGNMVISMYYPVYVEEECIGYVGAAVFANKLMESLISLDVKGLSKSEYVFLNVDTGEYLYNEDEELLCTETKEKGYIKMLEEIRGNKSENTGMLEYKDNKGVSQVIVYRYIPERNWVFAIKDEKDSVYSSLKAIKNATAYACVIISILVIIVLILVLTRLSIELGLISKAITKLGNMDLSSDDSLEKYVDRRDEIGIVCDTLNKACSNLRQYIGAVDMQLSAMAGGDFSPKAGIEFAGDFAKLQVSLEKIETTLRQSFTEIGTVTRELAVGSQTVADTSSGLADVAGRANTLVAEIDNHINDITIQLSESAAFAESAREKSAGAAELVLESQGKMNELNEALMKIEKATSAIQEISNNLEGFSKQTNILALNALVEATRANEAGKGFGVVANEIRVLAEQSNSAAVNSHEMIEQTLESVEEGMRLGKEASQYLSQVVSQAKMIDDTINKIAEATRAEDEKLAGINERLRDMSRTVEKTAGMAQQSAAASTELDGQANVLKDNIGQYRV